MHLIHPNLNPPQELFLRISHYYLTNMLIIIVITISTMYLLCVISSTMFFLFNISFRHAALFSLQQQHIQKTHANWSIYEISYNSITLSCSKYFSIFRGHFDWSTSIFTFLPFFSCTQQHIFALITHCHIWEISPFNK